MINLHQENPDSTEVDIADGMLELADWYLLFEKYDRAFALYERVWQLLEEDPARRDATFGAPTALYLPFPPNPKLPDGRPPGAPDRHRGTRARRERPRQGGGTRYGPAPSRPA